MSTRLIPFAGALLGLLLTLLVVLGVLLEQPLLTALGVASFGAAILTVQVDTWRRIRSQRNFLRDEIRRHGVGAGAGSEGGGSSPVSNGTGPAWGPPAAQEDVLGAVRLLQAQYTGRLDRMQRSLEQALAQVAAQRSEHDGR